MTDDWSRAVTEPRFAKPRSYTAAALCRLDRRLLDGLTQSGEHGRICVAALLALAAGAAAYGFAFGLWRHPLQACYSAAKMPLLFAVIVLCSAVINFMLARLLGASLSLRLVLITILLGMTVTAVLLGATSPIVAFFVLQLRAPGSLSPVPDRGLMRVYSLLIPLHVTVVAAAGIVGNLRVLNLLVFLTGSKRTAWRVLVAWLLVIGFVGCELSWLFSPFLCKPTYAPHVFSREYFQQNFYERIWQCVGEMNWGG